VQQTEGEGEGKGGDKRKRIHRAGGAEEKRTVRGMYGRKRRANIDGNLLPSISIPM